MKCVKGLCPGTIAVAAFGVFAVGYSGYSAITGDCILGSCSTEAPADQSLVAPVSSAADDACPLSSGCSEGESTTVLASESESSEDSTCTLAASECDSSEKPSVTLVSGEGDSEKQCPLAAKSCDEAKLAECSEKKAQCDSEKNLADAAEQPETVQVSDNG